MGRTFESERFSVTHASVSTLLSRHVHPETMLSYYLRGQARCCVGDNKRYDLHAGDLALLSPGLIHQDSPLTPTVEYLSVKIKKEFFVELFDDLGAASREPPYFPFGKLGGDPAIRRICERLLAELWHQEFGQEAMLSSLVTELAVSLVRRFGAATFDRERLESDRRMAPWQVRKALELVHDTYTQEFSLASVASTVGVSKYYLDRLFKRTMGLPLHLYVILLRIDRARHLLASGDRSLVEIAAELGFSDQSHFTNLFKRYTGLTPLAYRISAK